MTVIKWRNSYNTGALQFDKEHHKLVELINSMYCAVRDKSGKEVAVRCCDELIAYTLYHFENEEKAMADAHYPELVAHREEHLRLRQEAQNFRNRIDADFPEGVIELYHFLRNWLINHIQGCDKKYVSFL